MVLNLFLQFIKFNFFIENCLFITVSNFQFISKVNSYPLDGEANFLRYLTRSIKNYDYENLKSSVDTIFIDNILDLSLEISCEESKNINIVIAKLTGYLNKNPWFLNYTNPSIGDIATWSTIKQKAHVKIPYKLKNWYDLCEKTFISI